MKRILSLLVLFNICFSIFAKDNAEKLCDAIIQHKYAQALKLIEKVDSISEDAIVPPYDLLDFIEYSQDKGITLGAYFTLLEWYASVCQAWGDLLSTSNENYEQTEHLYKEVANVYEDLHGDTSQQYINAITQLFTLYSENNQLNKAQEQIETLILIYSNLQDTIHVCSYLNAYGFIAYRLGENQYSDDVFRSCDSIVMTLPDIQTKQYIDVTYKEQRALMYYAYRDYDRALNAYKNLKVLVRQYYEPNKIIDAIYDTYIGLILLSKNLYRSEEAELLLREAYSTLYDYRETNDQIKSCFVTCGFAYSRILYMNLQFEEAEKILMRIKDVDVSANGLSHDMNPQYPAILSELAVINWIKGDIERAEKYIDECVEKNELLAYFAGGNYYPYANSVFQQAIILSRTGKQKEAYEAAVKSYQLQKKIVQQNLSFLSSEQRNEYWNTTQFRFTNEYPNLFYKYSTIIDTIAIDIYDNELFYKGILLQTSTHIQNSILNSGDTMLIQLWYELQQIEATLLYDNNLSDNSHLIQRRNDIDKFLTNKCLQYQEARKISDVKWQDVQQELDTSQIAIEITSFQFFRNRYTDSTMYCALLLRNNSEYPELISLFEEKEVTTLINTTTENLTSFTYSYDGNGKKLSNLVWNKILPYIKPGETIYFAPSGLLHQLAIEAMPYDETHTMADMFNLVRLSSTREIVLRKDELKHSTATLYGGIQYNMSGDELLAESEQYATTNLLASRGIDNDTLNRGTVDYLKGTKIEVENINRMLKDNKLQVQLFTSKAANEESFKALSGKHQNILHIATHGFYWPDSTAHKKDYFSQRMMLMDNDRMAAPPAIDPLNRCGLLFAGANTALSGKSNELPDGVQDGILTAKEISLLDLRDADLVVLSACETGKGEITGEGVFGLQRAFKQAGAQTIIMSLWPVNDNATQLLMTEFYRNWITNHQSKREAFRNAQNTVRSQYPEPVYWAGFIMLD